MVASQKKQVPKLSLYDLFQRLYGHFGPCHWWPGETPFEVIVGAILTQNTAWKNVESAIDNLKTKDVLEPERLEKLSQEELALLIRSSGYYNQKARKIKSFLEYYKSKYSYKIGDMAKILLEELREDLLQIYGIGEETADSILLYALNKPTFVVDAYTNRILSRIGYTTDTISYKKLKRFCEESLPQDTKLYNEFHALFVLLGKSICKSTPLCIECPVHNDCLFFISKNKRK